MLQTRARVFCIGTMIIFSSCKEQQSKSASHLQARALYDSAMNVVFEKHDHQAAIDLLNQATAIDSNYVSAYYSKLSLQMDLKEVDSALITAKKLRSLIPRMPDYAVTEGLLYEMKGDTISSAKCFEQASVLYDRLLDTMSTSNPSYNIFLMNKAVNHIFMGHEKTGNALLSDLHRKQTDPYFKSALESVMNQSKRELIQNFISRKSALDNSGAN